jgi:8-oxo-dGTP diphosphatase
MEPRQVFRSYERNGAYSWEDRYCPRCGEKLEPSAAAQKTAGGASSARLACGLCGFVGYRNPLPGVVVLVEREGKVLLCRRSADSFQPGKWCLPGGFLEYEEDFLSAGIREAKEETGLDVRIEAILSVVSNFLSPRLHTLVVVLLGRVFGGDERPGDDATQLAWVPLSGPLPEMAFDADAHIIQRYNATGLRGAPVDPLYAGGSISVDQ